MKSHFQAELGKRDKQISDLEFEVKSLRNTLNLCITLINELKMKETNVNEKTVFDVAAKKPVFQFGNPNPNPKMVIELFNNKYKLKHANGQENAYSDKDNFQLTINKK